MRPSEFMKGSEIDGKTDLTTAATPALSIWFQTAMKAGNGKFEKVEAWRTQRGVAFRIRVPVPMWAQQHLAEFVTAEIQREQDLFAERAAARAAKNEGSV